MDELCPSSGKRGLRFEYIHARSEVEARYRTISRYEGGIKLTTPNWIIADAETGEECVPRKDDDGFTSSDYLLISRLPNRITKKSIERSSEVLVVGGAHGASLSDLQSLFDA